MIDEAVTVSSLWVYPVKGLGGVSIAESVLTSRGLRFDRRFMVVDKDHEFVSQREMPRMATIWMDLIGGEIEFASPDQESIRVDAEPNARATRDVRVWASTVPAHTVSAEANEWLSDLLGFNATLVYMPDSSLRHCNAEYAKSNEIVSFADGFPVLITNEASLADLNARIEASGGMAVPMNRFRTNIVVTGAAAWAEDDWHDFSLGEAHFRNAKPCTRCQVTTTDQTTGEVRGPEPLQTLARFRDSAQGVRFGVNLLPVRLGRLRVGDVLQSV